MLALARVQVELQPAVLLGAPRLQLHRRTYFRYHVTTALFAGGNSDFLPLLDLFCKRSASSLTPQRSENSGVMRLTPSSIDFWMVNSIFAAGHHLA